ncbi:hypothetical protein HK405_000598 [Cladochytrium tenue]|nr:hypothetical protein HK405_000598 [Cladochytrium tenue]
MASHNATTVAAVPANAEAAAAAPAAAPAADFDATPFLSLEARSRSASVLKSFYPITIRPGMRSLGGGLPHPSSFAVTQFTAGLHHHEAPDSHSAAVRVAARGSERSAVVDEPTAAKPLTVEEFLQYAPGTGWGTARDAIRSALLTNNDAAPKYADWDFIVTHGNTSAFDMCMRTFFDRGDGMIVEEYAYSSVLEQMVPHGVTPVSVRVDAEGMVPSDIRRAVESFRTAHPHGRCNVLYIVPTGQNPTGTVMGVQRRRDLLAVCRELGLLVVEDDPYSYLELPDYLPAERRSEYRFRGIGGLMPTLLSMDTEGRVVHLFTFSKILAPGFRVGFMAANKALLKYLTFTTEVTVQSASGFSQGYLSGILNQWGRDGLDVYAVGLQKQYTHRRDVMIEALLKAMGPIPAGAAPPAEFVTPCAGMFVWLKVNLPAGAPASTMTAIHQRLVDRGVLVIPGELFVAERYARRLGRIQAADRNEAVPAWATTELDQPIPYFRMAFSFAKDEMMAEAMVILAEVLTEFGCGGSAGVAEK